MQQLQRHPLQQLQAWQHDSIAKRCPEQLVRSSRHAGRHLQLQQAAVLQDLLLQCRITQSHRLVSCNSASADGAAGGGDVVRPSAKAAAPPASPVDLTGQSSTAAGSSSTNSSTGSYSSYSDMYKALHSSNYSKPADSKGSKAKPSSSAPAASHGGPATASTGTQTDAFTSVTSGNGHQQISRDSCSLQEPPSSTAAVDAAGVEDAIRKAQEALAAAEDSLTSVQQLRSAQPRSRWHGWLQLLRSVVMVVASGALLVASHAFGLGWQWAGATLGAIGLAGVLHGALFKHSRGLYCILSGPPALCCCWQW